MLNEEQKINLRSRFDRVQMAIDNEEFEVHYRDFTTNNFNFEDVFILKQVFQLSFQSDYLLDYENEKDDS